MIEERSATKKNVTVTIAIAKETSLHVSVDLELKLRNDGTSIIMYGESMSIDCHLSVVTSEGHCAPYTIQGNNRYGRSRDHFGFTIEPLGPGESKTWSINLKNVFLMEPESYTVTVTVPIYEGPRADKIFNITASRLPFTIMDKPASAASDLHHWLPRPKLCPL